MVKDLCVYESTLTVSDSDIESSCAGVEGGGRTHVVDKIDNTKERLCGGQGRNGR